MKNKRAPIEQLREAGRLARRMLKEKGIEAKDSVLDRIVRETATTLPGIPNYLPHKWTLKAAQRIMYDLMLMWKDKCGDDYERAENITAFFTFVVAELRKQEKEYLKEERRMPTLVRSLKKVPLLKDVFGPMRKRESAKAMQRFFIDAFAVSIVVKSNDKTSDFANWFIEWTEKLYTLWSPTKDEDRIKA